MLLGSRLPGAYPDWRIVEGDLYDISRRVREYDSNARLIRKDGAGTLGLAVWQPDHPVVKGGGFTFVREVVDLTTDTPLTGAPDERVIRFMRATDSRRLRNLNDWYRRSFDAHQRREIRAADASYVENYEHADRYVHALGKDMGSGRRAFIPERKAA